MEKGAEKYVQCCDALLKRFQVGPPGREKKFGRRIEEKNIDTSAEETKPQR